MSVGLKQTFENVMKRKRFNPMDRPPDREVAEFSIGTKDQGSAQRCQQRIGQCKAKIAGE
jgi:hypothetical protein